MIQFNLLPDVKVEYMRTERVKRTVMFAASGVSLIAFLTFFGLLILVKVVQPNHIESLSEDIKQSSNNLKDTKDLNKILTIQSQLGSLPGVHETKPDTTRLFNYIAQFTPSDIKLSSITVDHVAKTMTLSGTASTAVAANQFADTLKSTQYIVLLENESEADAVRTQAFTGIKSALPISGGKITYTIDLTYDEALFDNKKNIKLIIPTITSTASSQGLPSGLFEAAPVPTTGQEGDEE